MKVDLTDTNFDSNLDDSGSEFQIASTAYAFQVLSKNLYSDIPRAIVRELLCNAIDASIKHQSTIPVHLSLPSQTDRDLIIQDFGAGMSSDEIQEIYTTYFASSKRETNDETGMLGLGAKTPFAYTSQFSLTTCFNGKAYEYLLFKNEKGIPSILKVSETPTTDTGTKVCVPIHVIDEDAFIKAAILTLPFLQYPVDVIKGNDELLVKLMAYQVIKDSTDYDNWMNEFHKFSLTTTTSTNSSTGALGGYNNLLNKITTSPLGIVMGGVFYDVSSEIICNDKIQKEEVLYPVSRSYSSKKVIAVPIGSVDIQPNRESLNYSDKTKAYLKEVFFKEFLTDIETINQMSKDNFEAMISTIKCPFQILSIIDIVRRESNGKFYFSYQQIESNLCLAGSLFNNTRSYLWVIHNEHKKKFRIMDRISPKNSWTDRHLRNAKTIYNYIFKDKSPVIVVNAKDEKILEKDRNSLSGAFYVRILDTLQETDASTIIVANEECYTIIKQICKEVKRIDLKQAIKIPRKRIVKPDIIDINGNPISYDQIVDDYLKGSYFGGIAYELYDGEWSSTRRPSTFKNLYVKKDVDLRKNKEDNVLLSNWVGTACSISSFFLKTFSILKKFKVDGIVDDIPSTMKYVACKWSAFKKYKLYEKDFFHQTFDVLTLQLIQNLEKIANYLKQHSPWSCDGIIGLYQAEQYQRSNVYNKDTVFGREIESILKNRNAISPNTILDMEGFTNEIEHSLYFDFLGDKKKSLLADIRSELIRLNNIKEYDRDYFINTYPLFKWIDKFPADTPENIDAVLGYVRMIGK
jgi:hypothetical protein